MSQDIRSLFSAMAKKKTGVNPKKPIKILDSDDEDIVENTPEKVPVKQPVKRRAHVLSSDSEDDGKAKKQSSKSPPKKHKASSSEKKKEQGKKNEKPNLKKLKPVDIDYFNRPIKQSEVKPVPKEVESSSKEEKTQEKKKKSKKGKKSETSVHNDKAFEMTLKNLDDDDDDDTDDTILLDNLDLLDKTIEEAMRADQEATSEETNENGKTDTAKLEKKIASATSKEINKNDKTATSKLEKKIDSAISKETNQNGKLDTPKLEKKIDSVKETKVDSVKKKAKEEKITPKKRARKTSESSPTPTKKPKLEQTDSGIDDWAKMDRKFNASGMYASYLHRGGPKNHGEKEYPKGKPDCLKNLTFLRTGVLDSLEGEEFENLVTDHGGRVVRGVSKKVNFMVVGDQPGPAKMEKAKKYGIPEIDEDQFLDMILVKSGEKPRYVEKRDTQSDVASEDLGIGGSEDGSPKLDKKPLEEGSDIKKEPKEDIVDIITPILVKIEDVEEKVKIKTEEKEKAAEPVKIKVEVSPKNMAWTDKYKPTSMDMIIGQQQGNSNMNKLKTWLERWFKNADPEVRKKLPRPTLYNQLDGASFKAALLNGSPGVGKTTTATLVAKSLGFDIVEFNASDTRNKRLLHDEISHMMGSKTLSGFKTLDKKKKTLNQKRVLLMDEVDGMAGNEDRGGIAELIMFIKAAKFPIICMCNNKDLQKMRTLVTHCYNLNFEKPRVAQIRGAMMSVCFKEGLNIKPDALAQLIEGTGCDIRQTLNHLSMWSAAKKDLSLETVEKESKNSQKDVVFGVWDVTKKVFTKAENKDMSLVDKSRLFFYDYSMLPLFIQENYLFVEPECTDDSKPKNLEILLRRQKTAECLSVSDLIESKIRSTNNWSLLESQAFYSTVFPSYYMSGTFTRVRFPGWFGKHSTRTKNLRIIGEINSHARTSISGDKVSVRLDYAEPLLKKLLTPIQEKQEAGIPETLDVMKSYSLLRDDLTNLCDLMAGFRNKANPFDSISSKVKSALTRTYNKTMTLNFAPPAASKKKKGEAELEGLLDEEAGLLDEEDDETEDNVETDTLIKVKTKASTSKASDTKKDSKAKGKAKDTKGTKGKNKK